MESVNDKLKKIYYDPSLGLLSSDKLYRKSVKLIPELKRSDVNKFIKSQELNQVFKQRKVKHKFPLVSNDNFDRIQIDLLDVNLDATYNNNVKFLFCACDVYTKYAFVLPLKSKSDNEVFKAFKSIIEEIEVKAGFPPLNLDSDKESSFMSRQFTNYCKEKGIIQHFVEQAYQVERFNRTIRSIIEKYKSAFGTRKYINVLPQLVTNYNTTYNSNIQTTPLQAISDNSKYDKVKIKKFHRAKNEAKKKDYNEFKIGDKVRLRIKKTLFEKKTSPLWTKTVHTIQSHEDGVYYVNDRQGGYRGYDLQKVGEVQEFIPLSNEEKQEEQNVIQQERRVRRSTRLLNKEGVDKKDIEADPEPRQMRKYRKPRSDLGFSILT